MQCSASTTMDIAASRGGDQLDGSLALKKTRLHCSTVQFCLSHAHLSRNCLCRCVNSGFLTAMHPESPESPAVLRRRLTVGVDTWMPYSECHRCRILLATGRGLLTAILNSIRYSLAIVLRGPPALRRLATEFVSRYLARRR